MARRQDFDGPQFRDDSYGDVTGGDVLPAAPTLPMGGGGNDTAPDVPTPAQAALMASDAANTGATPPPTSGPTPQSFTASSQTTQPVITPTPTPQPTQGDQVGTTVPAVAPFTFGADANNQFGGQTYAGFSPQEHQGVDLNDPMNAKYALQQFLAQNGGLTGGPTGNAAAQAAALNARYGQVYGNPNFFTAVDAETIMMPDGQYVHFAPNGYGMAPGTFNPNANSEVFWGASGSPFSGGGGGAGAPAPSSGGSNSFSGFDIPSFEPQSLSMQQLLDMGKTLSFVPNQNVGTDPLSNIITGGLGDLITSHGMTPEMSSVFATLKDIIGRSGRLPSEDPIVQQQLETAREQEGGAFTGQLADARAALANRGLVGEPGIPQGEEGGAVDRISQNLAVPYSQSVRDINTASIQRQNDRLTTSLSAITGLSTSAANNLLNSLGQGTQRQLGLAQIALDTLQQNIQWNEFLANYGLQRDQITASIQNGNVNALLPLLTLFSQQIGTTAGGQVKNT